MRWPLVVIPGPHTILLMSAAAPAVERSCPTLPTSRAVPRARRSAVAVALAVACGAYAAIVGPVNAAAQAAPGPDSSGFVIRLGVDTLAIERVLTYPDSIIGDLLTRSPRTSRFAYRAYLNTDHNVVWYDMVHYATGLATDPVDARMNADFQTDSAHVIVQRGDSSRAMSYAAPRTAVPLLEPGFGLHQLVVARALAARGRRLPFAWVYVPDIVDTGSIVVGPHDDTVRIMTPTDTIRAVVDAAGHVLEMTDPGGTFQATATRVAWPDLDRWAADFMARDTHGKGLGSLSPRDTVRATIGTAMIMVDYSRPSKRGRRIFGNIIPWNTVWRTGANWATTFVIDKDVMVGPTRVPAGRYTLFTVPAPTGWTLIVSRKTGEWGTEYDSTADFARIPIASSKTASPVERFTIAVAQPHGSATGVLTLSWDTVMATVPLRAPRGSGQKSGS